jgi:hypothetical protein
MNKKKTITKAKKDVKVQSKSQIAAKVITEKPVIPTIKPLPTVKPVPSKAVVKNLPTIETTPVSRPVSKVVSKPIVVANKTVKKDLLKVQTEDETYFVYLKNPLEYRRQLLECSRKVLFCLKIHQEVFIIRQKKIEEMHRLKNSVKELLYLNKKFNEKLPKYNNGALGNIQTKDHVKPTHANIHNARKPVEIKAEKSEMDRLEESLASIEKKLRTLQ